MVKEQMIMALPIVAAIYFPRRERVRHILIALAALAPFALFFCQRAILKGWHGVAPTGSAWTAAHFAAYARRVSLQFGTALPIVVIGAIALLALARRRAFVAILLVALADAGFFFVASVQQYWAGYPRTNFVPLICVAIALGTMIDRFPRRLRSPAVLIVLACNVIPLLPEMRAAFGADTGRNFVEDAGAPIFYPVRQALTQAEQAGLIQAGDEVHLLNNGKRVFGLFYPGPAEEQYPDLARRYRLRVMSFRDDVPRCRCSSPGTAQIAFFIAFHNLGANMPERPAIEEEAERCRAAIAATCKRVMAIDQAVIGR
jgi:hypothetical protein